MGFGGAIAAGLLQIGRGKGGAFVEGLESFGGVGRIRSGDTKQINVGDLFAVIKASENAGAEASFLY